MNQPERRRDIKCPTCEQSFRYPTYHTFFPPIDIEELVQKNSTDEKNAFKKLFCALLNSQEVNLVIFHVPDCRIVGVYDKKVNEWLMSLVPDGSAYQDTFERIGYDATHFWVRVKPPKDNESRFLSTLDFHTCFSLDKGLRRQQTHFHMKTFLKKPNHDSDTGQTLPKKDDFIVDQEVLIDGQIPFTENVYRQAKGSEHGANGNEHRKGREKPEERPAMASKHVTNGSVPRKWKEKLGEYISAFSKVPGGGTVYYGVDEKTQKKPCELTSFICKGVHLDEKQKESWEHFCHETMKKMLWVAPKPPRSTPGIEVDFIRPKHASEECCVIIVTVKQFKGVGFLRKDGPESYELDENDNPTEVKPWDKWARLSRCKDLVVVSTD